MTTNVALVGIGALVALVALFWFGLVRGGLFSLAGLFLLMFWGFALVLVLAGFGAIPFPGVAR